WSFELSAFWMMFFDGYIAAPPTITVFSAAKLGAVAFIARLSAKTAAPAKARAEIRFMALSGALFAVPSGGDIESYGAPETKDAGARSQVRELTGADHRAGREAGGRAARRLKRNRQDSIIFCQTGQVARERQRDRRIGAQKTDRSWPAV